MSSIESINLMYTQREICRDEVSNEFITCQKPEGTASEINKTVNLF